MKELTLQQKKTAIQEFCNTNETCKGCPLYGFTGSCSSDTTAERNYKTLVEHNYIEPPSDDPKPTESSKVNHPSHYNQGDIECIDAMESAFGREAVKHFCICNAFKYNWRAKEKNGTEDINKAIWYLNKYKELSDASE